MILARSTDQTSSTYRSRAGFKICGFRSGQGSNAKYTTALDGLGQHLTVARFKDVQGQGSMREQRAFGKEQRAQGVRNLYWIHRKSLSRRNAKARRGILTKSTVKLLPAIVTMQLFYSKVPFA